MADQALADEAGPRGTEAPLGSGARAATRYEDDLYTWAEEQVAHLRAGRLEALDLANIAEELSDVGGALYDQLESALRVLLTHMLKWDEQPQHRTPSWIFSIREQRRRYARLLRKHPGLQSRIGEAREEAYPDARDWAADETHLSPDRFPHECPYTWDDILDRPFEFDSVKR